MRITNNIILHNTTGNINGNKVNVNNLNNQMTSQKKIQRPSENPVIAVRSLRPAQHSARLTSITRTIFRMQNPDESDRDGTWEFANMKTILTDIRTQCTYGASDQITADDRKTILTPVREAVGSGLRGREMQIERDVPFLPVTYTNQKSTFMTDDNTTSYNITQGLSYKNLEEHRYYSDETHFRPQRQK